MDLVESTERLSAPEIINKLNDLFPAAGKKFPDGVPLGYNKRAPLEGRKRGDIPDETAKQRQLSSLYDKMSRLPDDRLAVIQRLVSDFTDDKFAALQTLVSEFSAQVDGSSKPLPAPAVRPLREDPEFIQFVKDNLWETRRERGIPWRKDVFEFVTETYGGGGDDKDSEAQINWIGERGMIQADLIGLNDALYTALRVQLSRKGAPKGFVFPMQKEAALAAVTDPKQRELLLTAREHTKKANTSRRAIVRPR